MIGKICTSTIPYYDVKNHRKSFKSRPILIISDERNNDYNVLPISTVSKKEYIDFEYDIPVTMSNYPNLHLNKDSYIRTHKQTTVYKGDVIDTISDLKSSYGDLYLEVMAKLEQYNNEIINNAI